MSVEETVKSIDLAVADLKLTKSFLLAAVDAQWIAPPSPSTLEDVGVRSQGDISDPTGDIATNPKRLNLRQGLKTADKQALAISWSAGYLLSDLARAMRPYSGDR